MFNRGNRQQHNKNAVLFYEDSKKVTAQYTLLKLETRCLNNTSEIEQKKGADPYSCIYHVFI